MLLVWMLKPLLALSSAIVALFPAADVDSLVVKMGPATRVVTWVMKLNEAFPVDQLFLAAGAVGIVAGALYGVMLVRRIFSLVWPGAGS